MNNWGRKNTYECYLICKKMIAFATVANNMFTTNKKSFESTVWTLSCSLTIYVHNYIIEKTPKTGSRYLKTWGNSNTHVLLYKHIWNRYQNTENGFIVPQHIKMCQGIHNQVFIMIKILSLHQLCLESKKNNIQEWIVFIMYPIFLLKF